MNGVAQIVNRLGLEAAAAHKANPRLAREFRTIKAMVHIYCRDHHGHTLCDECKGLMDYAGLRLARCRFGAEKPTCARCPVHCYQRNRREQVKIVMRYAGPRMLWKHPLLSLRHWLDGFRPVACAHSHARNSGFGSFLLKRGCRWTRLFPVLFKGRDELR